MYIPEIRKLQDLLISFLGQPKNRVSDDCLQMQFPCPRCIEEKGKGEEQKYNLEITLGKDLFSKGGLFHCWSCCANDDTMKGGVYKLIKMFGNGEILRSYKSIIEDMRTSDLYKLPEYKTILGEIEEDNKIYLPKTYTKIESIEKTPKQVKEYLIERGFTDTIISKFDIGYTTREPDNPSFSNRIIIPSYSSNGILQFWSGRDFTHSNKRPKYYNSPGVDKNQIVFQESHIEWNADILLVEGALDTVFSPPNTIGLLGKILNKDMLLYKVLTEKAKAKVIIGLDGDTTIQEIKKIYRILNNSELNGRVRYIIMDKYKDMADAFKDGGARAVIDILKNQHTFSEFELLF